MEILQKALENPEIPYFLIIEEINRTDTAATFGDIFQLLDRGPDGESSYKIDISEDMKKYFDDYLGMNLENNKIYIPNNLYIWSTMNSADQGVYPLDSAFKRRWSMEYIDIDNGWENRTDKEITFESWEPIKWNKFRNILNGIMDDEGIREDKQIAVFFLKDEELNQEGFINKLLMYLSEDVFRHNKKVLFKENTYGKIKNKFLESESIFVSEDLNELFKQV